jgi:GDSL/SGNH-like Acyl-Esterase family found in Pmr5 and Cas1p
MPQNISHPNCSRSFELPSARPRNSHDSSCSLKRFTGSEAQACLRGKHVVFIGDSLMRHQMEGLTILLETGERGEPVTGDATPHRPDFPNATNYNGCGPGPLRCDTEAKRVRGDNDGIVKNRYYRNLRTATNLTAFGVYRYAAGHFPVGWRPHTTPFNRTALGWQRGGIPTIAKLIQEWFGQVDVVVANIGIWARDPSSTLRKAEINGSDENPQRHYLYGPVDKVAEELECVQRVSREVRKQFCCDRFTSAALVAVIFRFNCFCRLQFGRPRHSCKLRMESCPEMKTTQGLLLPPH